MKKIEKYIPKAIDVLDDTTLGIVKNGKIDSTYNGYLSSFGASIITSGVLPTFIFYSKKAKNDNDADRSLLIKAIEKMIKGIDINILQKQVNGISKEITLLEKVMIAYDDNQLKKMIQNCAIALKLAIRTYPNK